MVATTNLHEYTVSELSGALKTTIEENFSLVRVRGELGRVTRAASGHMYMDMKDDRAVISGVIWKGMAERLSIKPEQGMEVIATGRMTTFPGQSRYQIIIDSIEPAGAGALMALFEARKKQLASEGLFAEDRKKPLPFLPRIIGVVTSPTGAVIRDILHRLRERFPAHVIVWPTLVQGKDAEKQIVAAINGFNALEPGGLVPRPDVLIVARGGGSIEDLWCFNEEAVVRAAAASTIPLISAVGHETDTTLIDYVSDRRAPTPTAAAEFAVPVRSELVSELLNKQRRLVDAQARLLAENRAALRAATRGLGRPEDILGSNAQRLDRLSDQLTASLHRRVTSAQTQLLTSAGQLTPRILGAGFEARASRINRAADRLVARMLRTLERRKDRVRSIRLGSAALAQDVQAQVRGLDAMTLRLAQAGSRLTDRQTQTLTGLEKMLASLSHKNVLARGFALVRDDTGTIIRTVKALKPGTTGSVEVADGKRAVTFGDGAIGDGSIGGPRDPANKKRLLPKTGRAEQKNLFD